MFNRDYLSSKPRNNTRIIYHTKPSRLQKTFNIDIIFKFDYSLSDTNRIKFVYTKNM